MLYRKKDYLHQWKVTWKKTSKFPVDVFDSLKDFCIKHPAYQEQKLLRLMKVQRSYRFENEEMLLQRIPFQFKEVNGERPNLRDNFFWEWVIPEINWNRNYKGIIERVLSRGLPADFEELARFYGQDTVLNVFRNQCSAFWDNMEEDARLYFKLEREDLLIYHIRKSHNFWTVWNRKTG